MVHLSLPYHVNIVPLSSNFNRSRYLLSMMSSFSILFCFVLRMWMCLCFFASQYAFLCFVCWTDINLNHTDLSFSCCFFLFLFYLQFNVVISSSTYRFTTTITTTTNRFRTQKHHLPNDKWSEWRGPNTHTHNIFSKSKQQRTKKASQPIIWTISFVHSLERVPASFIVYRNLFIRFINYQMHNWITVVHKINGTFLLLLLLLQLQLLLCSVFSSKHFTSSDY